MKQKTLCLAVVSMLTIALGSAWAAGTLLPYGEGFEAGINSTNGYALAGPWTSASGVARVDNNETTVDGSVNSAYISDEADLDVSALAVESNVWWFGYAKVTAQTDGANPPIGTSVAGFFLESDGDVRAYSNDQWVTVGNVGAAYRSGWIGFSVHLDYVNGEYDIYRTADGFSYGDDQAKMNGGGLVFNNGHSSTKFEQFSVEGTTYLDLISLSAGEVTDAVGASAPANSQNAAEDIYLEEGFGGVLIKYFESGERNMGGKLGDALRGALVDGDKVFIRNPADGSWSQIECNGPGADWTVTTDNHGGGLASMTVDGASGIYIQLDGTGTRQPATVTGFDTTYQATDKPLTQSAFNLLAVPLDATENLSIVNGATAMGLPDPIVGDRLYIINTDDTLGYYTFLICRTAGVWTDITGSNANVTFVPGQAFWFYRGATAGTWDVDNVATGVY